MILSAFAALYLFAFSGLEPCKPDGAEEMLLCGTLTVPENWEKPGERSLSINIIVAPALTDSPDPIPWFNFEGGPSNPASEYLPRLYTTELRAWRARRDVVILDQRGSAKSGRLFCPELDEPDDPLMPRFHMAAIKSCAAKLSKEVDLGQYTSANAARDFDAVREALGYKKIHIFGLSYGSLLALVFAERYPDRVASLVLWGPVPPNFQRPRYYARDAQAAINIVFSACAARGPCNAAFPALHSDLRKILNTLEEEPEVVDWETPDGTRKAALTVAVFADGLNFMLYNTARHAHIPYVIHSAARGDFGPYLSQINNDGRFIGREHSEAMYLSVTCPEETLTFELEDALADSEGTFMGADRLRRQYAACQEWPAAPIPADAGRPIEGSWPTLVIAGTADPVTPPLWGNMMVRSLPQARLITVREMGHLSTGMQNAECLDQIVNAFVDDPDPDRLDVSCLADMSPPEFQISASPDSN